MMTQETAIALRGVTAGYNGSAVVRNLDLEVRPGQMVGLFGANGAGKTTTLLTVAGELKPLSGEVLLNGRRHPGSLFRSARNERLALLTDDRGIFAPLTVRENLRLGRGSVQAALEHFPQLEGHLDRKAGLLSGGQQQMLALGRILASRPAIILADELSLGLAPLVVKGLIAALRSAADAGAAVLLIEQHIPVALAAVDRVCVLARGEKAMEDSAESVRSAPERISQFYLQ